LQLIVRPAWQDAGHAFEANRAAPARARIPYLGRGTEGCGAEAFTILGNHLHLIVEADGTRAFTRGVRALAIRVALGLNRMMGRNGPVFADRYDVHVLRTPAEVQNAVRYVLGNFESHAARRGEPRSTKGWVDPFSSAAARGPRREQLVLFDEVATSAPETWLLRKAS
jgi:hypothetical protein